MNQLQRINMIGSWLKERFKEKVVKLSLDGGFTCPNRDGTKGTGGCIFCSPDGSGELAGSIPQQIALLHDKWPAVHSYLAYFQSHTGTYAPIDYLESLYRSALSASIPDGRIVGLAIATRPDCLGDDVLKLLDELNKIKPIFVELGLQTMHERTAQYIRRGYSLEVYDKAVNDLHKIGVNVVTHLILGLPNETEDDIIESVKYVCRRTDGIKLQLLHILDGTDLADEYKNGKVSVMTLDEYTDLIVKCVAVIPENVVIHRLTGDGAKRDLIAPLWSADKKKVINTINKALNDN